MSWDPQILVFACNWCSYGGADAAGVSRFQYPPDVQIVRVMCSGRVDPGFVLRAFNKGADGVLVTGCHLGDCHYQDGNYKAEKRVEMLYTLLGQLGIQSERLGLEWISAAEGQRFANVITEFVGKIRKLGPANGGEAP